MNGITRNSWLAAGLAVLAGCTGDPVRIDSITDLSSVDLTRGRKITAEAGGFQFYMFVPINTNSRQRRAYVELLHQAGGDAIADVKVTEQWDYGFIGTTYWTIMEATAYPRKRTVPAR